NVMALAAGISSGLGQGDNAKAAIITRGLSEMVRLGSAMGCSRETFFGLAGLGDLVVTCTSEHSRNNRCGQLIGQGLTAEQAVKEVGMVVEGLNALPAAVALSEKYGVEMPIVEYVDALVKGKIESRDAVRLIMNRKKKDEAD
ncbi:MAG: glycerol-3-phosphate dehydrogenase, partial [Lachnospiraceae bacterium]|nr:glycerol-3-phosphate dehydrogenase [Lachnospiraceae bacterium]